jgi:DNA-binding response OmpR family regulator
MRTFTILVVDDDQRILDFLKPKLRSVGYKVLTAGNGVEALEIAGSQELDLLVLDLMMPEMDGFEMLKGLRGFSGAPVIILSARDNDIDKIKGLNLGADDYMPKPFNPDELIARIEAMRRRLKPVETRKTLKPLCFEDVNIDFDKRLVLVGGEQKYLTNVEWLLLQELAYNIGRLITYDYLLVRVWGPEYRGEVNLVRTSMSRLRRKLEKDPHHPRLIRTFPKAGYIMTQPSG